jgi:hypothetical protein
MKKLVFLLSFLFAAAVVSVFVLYNQLKIAKKDIHTIAIDPVILEKKLAQEPPKWMIEQIEKDLAPFQSGITREMLDHAFRGKKVDRFSLIRFTIQNGHISFSLDERNLSTRHFLQLLSCIQKLNEHIKLPDVDFVVSLDDGLCEDVGLGPCFTFAKDQSLDGVLIPDIKALAGNTILRQTISEANEKFKWEQKEEKCFWRGASTGGFSTAATWHKLARSQLVLLSLAHPEMIDARFHKVIQCEPNIPAILEAKGMVGSSVSREDHLKFKYLIDVDGNSCTYERYFWLLLSNSLVLKQMTQNVQWYYGGLTPYQHFVPVKADLSDLLEKIEWAKAHDAECKKMAERASQFVKDNLSSEDTLLYLYLLLQRYALLQKFN